MTQKEVASLADVKVRRARRDATASTKVGDITAQLQPRASLPSAPQASPPTTPPSPPPAAPSPPAAPAPVLVPPPAAAASPRMTTVAAPIAARIDLTPLTPPRPRPAPVAAEPARALAKEPKDWEFIDYWNRLRRDRPLPPLTLLDRELVAESWPDTLMVTYTTLDAPMPRIARLSRATGEIEYTPMVTDWIISRARDVAREGEATEDEQEFPLAGGITGYRLLLLPFAGAQGESDHILCHLRRARKERAA